MAPESILGFSYEHFSKNTHSSNCKVDINGDFLNGFGHTVYVDCHSMQ